MRFVAYVTPEWRPQIQPVTHGIFEATGVELRDLPAPPAWKKPYPHGNKIVASCDMRGDTHGLFMDTDMVCVKPLTEFMDLPADTIACAPEGR